MNANLYIGISMFFLVLRKLGLYNDYIVEYMRYHKLTSPLKVKNNLASILSIDHGINGRYSHLKAFYCLCHSFVTVDISFGWADTRNKSTFWAKKNEDIKHAYYQYVIEHRLYIQDMK